MRQWIKGYLCQFQEYTKLTQMSQQAFNILEEQAVQRVIREHLKAQQAIYTRIAVDETEALSKKLSTKGIAYDSEEHLISIQKLIDKTLLAQSDYIHDSFVNRSQIHGVLKTYKKVKYEQTSQANRIKQLIEEILQEIQAPLIEEYEQKITKCVGEMQINDRIQSLPTVVIEEVSDESDIAQLTQKMREYDLLYSESLLSFSSATEIFGLKSGKAGNKQKTS